MSLSGGLMTGYVDVQGRRLLDLLRRSGRDHRGVRRQRPLPSDPGDARRRRRRGLVYKLHYWVERTLQDRRCGRRGRGARLCRVLRRGDRRLRAVGALRPRGFEGYAAINPLGQFIGAIIMFWVLGFLPAWVMCAIFKAAGVLRIPREIELVGLDIAEFHGRYLTRPTCSRRRSRRPRRRPDQPT